MPHGIGPEVLQNLLQNYLISDSSAVENLPFILSSLSKSCFVLRPSLSKWIARINSLFQSKDVSVKWAAACVAHRSASLSKDLTVECAPTWVSNAILIISVSKRMNSLFTRWQLYFRKMIRALLPRLP